MEVRYLPLIRIYKLQPLHAFIIDSMKLRYKHLHMERAIDAVDENIKYIYKLNILTEMRWVKKISQELPISIL